MSYAMEATWVIEGSGALSRMQAGVPQEVGVRETCEPRPRFTVLEGGLSSGGVREDAHREEVAPLTWGQRWSAVIFALVLAVALAMTALAMSASVEGSIEESVASLPAQTVTVHSGDSLWSIAEACDVDGYSTSDVVTWIRRRNHLESSALVPGQQLEVPVEAGSSTLR